MAAIAGTSIMVTGASRGTGRAIVEEALRRGAGHVYAGTHVPWHHPDERVTTLSLDMASPEAASDAASRIGSLDVLINSGGVPWDVIAAFLPQLAVSQGALVTSVPVSAMTVGPADHAYAASRMAAITQARSLRVLVAGTGVRVQAILAGPAALVPGAAKAIVDGIRDEEDYIIPGPIRVDYGDSRTGMRIFGGIGAWPTAYALLSAVGHAWGGRSPAGPDTGGAHGVRAAGR